MNNNYNVIKLLYMEHLPLHNCKMSLKKSTERIVVNVLVGVIVMLIIVVVMLILVELKKHNMI